MKESLTWEAGYNGLTAPQPDNSGLILPSPETPADRKLLDRLHNSNSTLTIKVNDVELTLDVVEVSRNAMSICCLVKHNGLRCKIPRSENVVIELEGRSFNTAFLGSWHTIDWLGVHVVVFPILPETEPA